MHSSWPIWHSFSIDLLSFSYKIITVSVRPESTHNVIDLIQLGNAIDAYVGMHKTSPIYAINLDTTDKLIYKCRTWWWWWWQDSNQICTDRHALLWYYIIYILRCCDCSVELSVCLSHDKCHRYRDQCVYRITFNVCQTPSL